MTRKPLSVIIIAHNEADRLPRTLKSVAWAEEIVVVDSGSTDGTQALARERGARVYEHPWQGYSRQKAVALEQATHRWILWVDADEEVTPRLRASIEAALGAASAGDTASAGEAAAAGDAASAGDMAGAAAYSMNRRTFYLGKFLRHGGWYPDRKTRLFDRERAGFGDELVHEELRVDGPVEHLEGDLNHYSYRDLSHHLEKTHEMARLWARQHRARRRVAGWELAVHPLAKAFKSYVARAGFLEGWRGVVLAGMASYSVWLKYALLREAQMHPASASEEGGPPAAPRSRN